MATSKAVVKKEETAVMGSIQTWAVTTVPLADVAEIIEDLSADGGFEPRDLPIIKIPSGGSTMWEYPTADGKGGGHHFDAVILYHHTHRKCWTAPYGAGQAGPPNCTSNDGLVGIGSPGGVCANCQLNHIKQHDTDITCAPRRNVFLLLPDLALPVLLDLPVTSLGAWDAYIKKDLSPTMRRAHRVLTRFELVQGQAVRGRQPYARLVVSRVADIPKEEWEAIDGYRAAFVQSLEAAYAAKKQIHEELTQGVSGQQNLWDAAPEAGIDDDDLPEIGAIDLTLS